MLGCWRGLLVYKRVAGYWWGSGSWWGAEELVGVLGCWVLAGVLAGVLWCWGCWVIVGVLSAGVSAEMLLWVLGC